MTPVTSLGLVSKGWRKDISKLPWGFIDRNREEPLNDNLQQHLVHISHIHIQVTQSHGITYHMVVHPSPSTPKLSVPIEDTISA